MMCGNSLTGKIPVCLTGDGGSNPTLPLHICCKCGEEKKTYMTFGKPVCRECLTERRTGHQGHSGMILRPNTKPTDFCIQGQQGLFLERVPKAHPLYTNWYLEHYPESKGIVGRQVNYLILFNGMPIGIIGGNSPPLNYKKFNAFFNSSEKTYLNNNVFRIVFKNGDRNLGTKILKQFRCMARDDYFSLYGDKLIGLITFVEPPRTGAVYKADNWTYLGMTQGIRVTRRGQDWLSKTYTKGNPKHIFARRL